MGQARTLNAALEENLSTIIPSSRKIVRWLVEHACYTLNKYEVDKEGRTAYGKLHGQDSHAKICDVGNEASSMFPASYEPNSM